MCKASSLDTIRQGLNRALKRYGHEFDMSKPACTSFTKSIKAFNDTTAELKQKGYGFVQNTKEIPYSGTNFYFY